MNKELKVYFSHKARFEHMLKTDDYKEVFDLEEAKIKLNDEIYDLYLNSPYDSTELFELKVMASKAIDAKKEFSGNAFLGDYIIEIKIM